MISNETKVPAFTEPLCSHGMPVAVATVQFDLHVGELCGEERMKLMRQLSEFVDVSIADLHMSAGKGHSTAFGFKNIIMITESYHRYTYGFPGGKRNRDHVSIIGTASPGF